MDVRNVHTRVLGKKQKTSYGLYRKCLTYHLDYTMWLYVCLCVRVCVNVCTWVCLFACTCSSFPNLHVLYCTHMGNSKGRYPHSLLSHVSLWWNNSSQYFRNTTTALRRLLFFSHNGCWCLFKWKFEVAHMHSLTPPYHVSPKKTIFGAILHRLQC